MYKIALTSNSGGSLLLFIDMLDSCALIFKSNDLLIPVVSYNNCIYACVDP